MATVVAARRNNGPRNSESLSIRSVDQARVKRCGKSAPRSP